MKVKGILKYVLLILILGGFYSCKSSKNTTAVNSLQGKWELKNVMCFCPFDDKTDFSGHTLLINASTIQITNPSQRVFIEPTGTYSFSTQDNYLKINKKVEYTFSLDKNTLTLKFIDEEELADDELTLTYTRK